MAWMALPIGRAITPTPVSVRWIGAPARAVAAAMAMAILPQAYQPDQSAAGVALSSFRGEQAIALGVSTISESGRYLFKVNASTSTRGGGGGRGRGHGLVRSGATGSQVAAGSVPFAIHKRVF